MSEAARESSHYRLLDPFQSEYVSAADLKGRDVVMTIRRVSVDEIPVEGSSEKKRKVIVEFDGAKKRMVLNVTNARTIADLYGPLTADWIGKRVALYPTTTKLKGKVVECIRIRERVPAPKRNAAPTAPAPEPTREDWPTGDPPPPDDLELGAAP